MEFIQEEQKKFEFNSISKSRLSQYQVCPGMAWKKLRETKRDLSTNELIEKGFLYHEFAAKELFSMCTNKDYQYDNSRLDSFTNLKIYNEALNDFKYINLNRILEGQAIIDIEKEISIPIPEVGEEFVLRAKPDALSYLSSDNVDYIGVIEFKSGYGHINIVDSESILYSYAISQKYNLPIFFQRVNLSNGKKFFKKFTVYELKNMKKQIVSVLKKWKKDMESEIMPEIKPGNHCMYCKYLKKCSGRKNINTLRQKYKAVILLKKLTKVYEDEIKDAAKLVLEKHPEYSEEKGEYILLPFLDNKYGAISKTSEFNGLANRKLKKDEVKDILIEHVMKNPTQENVDILKACMSLSLTDEVADLLESGDLELTIKTTENEGVRSAFKGDNYAIPVKRIIKTNISFKEKYEEDEDENNE